MKKTVAAVAILLLVALGGLGYMLFGMEEDPFGPEAVAVNQPQLGVKSQPKTATPMSWRRWIMRSARTGIRSAG